MSSLLVGPDAFGARFCVFSAALFCALTPACGGGPPAAAPAQSATPQPAKPVTMSLSIPGDLREMTFDGPRIYGSWLEIVHLDETYRGRAFNKPVDLRVNDNLIEGTVGGRTELHLKVEANSFTVQGLNADKLGSLEVRPDRIAGQLGGCQYDLRDAKVRGAYYQGFRACPTKPEPAALSFAPEVAAMPPKDRAALLALLLVR